MNIHFNFNMGVNYLESILKDDLLIKNLLLLFDKTEMVHKSDNLLVLQGSDRNIIFNGYGAVAYKVFFDKEKDNIVDVIGKVLKNYISLVDEDDRFHFPYTFRFSFDKNEKDFIEHVLDEKGIKFKLNGTSDDVYYTIYQKATLY